MLYDMSHLPYATSHDIIHRWVVSRMTTDVKGLHARRRIRMTHSCGTTHPRRHDFISLMHETTHVKWHHTRWLTHMEEIARQTFYECKFSTSFHGSPRDLQTSFHGCPKKIKQFCTEVNGNARYSQEWPGKLANLEIQILSVWSPPGADWHELLTYDDSSNDTHTLTHACHETTHPMTSSMDE